MKHRQPREPFAEIAHHLRAYGMPALERRAVLEDLRVEVAAAVQAGGDGSSIVGTDLRRFAQELAAAAGFSTASGRWLQVLAGGSVPMAVVAFVAFVGMMGGGEMLGFSPGFMNWGDSWRDSLSQATMLSLLAATLAAGLLAATGGVALALMICRDTQVLQTSIRVLAVLPLTTAPGLMGAMAIGGYFGYSTRMEIIAAECLIVASALGAGLVAARWLALREWPRLVSPRAREGA